MFLPSMSMNSRSLVVKLGKLMVMECFLKLPTGRPSTSTPHRWARLASSSPWVCFPSILQVIMVRCQNNICIRLAMCFSDMIKWCTIVDQYSPVRDKSTGEKCKVLLHGDQGVVHCTFQFNIGIVWNSEAVKNMKKQLQKGSASIPTKNEPYSNSLVTAL